LHITQEAKPNPFTSFPLARKEMDQEVLPTPVRQPGKISAGEIPPLFHQKLFLPASSPESVPFPLPNKRMPDKPPKNQYGNIASGHP
jgi:hypothetical protein